MTSFPSFRRGEIYRVNLDPTVGSEMKKSRPAVIVSDNSLNEASDTVVVCPITDATLKNTIIHILVTPEDDDGCGLTKDSVVHCAQIRAVDKTRLGEKIGELSQLRMAWVSKGIKSALSLF